MSAFELVVHHRYTSGSCADLSGYSNHGHHATTSTDHGGLAEPDGILFDGRTTRMVVFPSISLADLRGIRVRARVRLDALSDRRTIMEGYLAFSFSVEPDGALTGSIYSAAQWHEIRTPASTVPLHRWVDATFLYDGRDTATLSLDGVVVASRHANVGTVGGVQWPYGLNIGAWPDQDLRVFSGRMAEIWLWRLRR
jgi:Concanavalin A-like lectin/glucanases superfamily